MDAEVATLAADVVPYVSAAAAAYGGAVLAKVRDDAADATVGLGRRLVQRIFGVRDEGEPVPAAVADVVADPADEDALAALRLAVRKALAADAGLYGEVREMLAQAGVSGAGDVSNTISGGTFRGPVMQGRDFSGLTFGATPDPTARSENSNGDLWPGRAAGGPLTRSAAVSSTLRCFKPATLFSPHSSPARRLRRR